VTYFLTSTDIIGNGINISVFYIVPNLLVW